MKKITNFELYEAQGKRCFYCGEKMWFVKGPRSAEYTEDHFFAKCKGHGRKNNIVLAHFPCNQEKADRDPTPEECVKKKSMYNRIKKNRREKNCTRKKANKEIKNSRWKE